ncbi:MAG: transposase [Hungatella sp.]|jgi:transposase|nr:transposase [Hungatella sp.]
MALKILYQICCGVDVHKTFVAACIASTNKQAVTTYKNHPFSTFTQGLKELLQRLLDNSCKDVSMESTGKYWIPIYNVLEETYTIVLAHPKYVKAIRGKKTDKKDAKWIVDLILTAPSFKNTFTAIGIISEIGVNMETFPSAKHLCSWAGLTPTNNERAGKKKSVRVSKAGCYIKPLLVQCANSVVKSEKHPEIRNRYLRLRKRLGHKKAIIAIARMLLTALYNMLKNKKPYNAELYRKSDILPVNREITIEQAILLAQLQGYKIKSATE